MRLTYVLLLAASFGAPAMADEIIIQGPQPGQAKQATRDAQMERRDAQQDANAARRAEMEAGRDLRHGNLGGALREDREAQRDLNDLRRDRNEARQDVNRARRDEDWRVRIER